VKYPALNTKKSPALSDAGSLDRIFRVVPTWCDDCTTTGYNSEALMNSDRAHDPPSQVPTSEHPSGTLAIVVIYALLFVGGWLAMYLFVFLSRGRVTP
jgi:hypothetical protein